VSLYLGLTHYPQAKANRNGIDEDEEMIFSALSRARPSSSPDDARRNRLLIRVSTGQLFLLSGSFALLYWAQQTDAATPGRGAAGWPGSRARRIASVDEGHAAATVAGGFVDFMEEHDHAYAQACEMDVLIGRIGEY